MPVPANINSYGPEWMALAQELHATGAQLLRFGDVKVAKTYRLKFYGFRKAYLKHDPTSPFNAAMMETEARVTSEGHLALQRSPMAHVLRGLLEYSKVSSPPVETPSGGQARGENDVWDSDAADKALMDVLRGAEEKKS